MLRLKRIVPVFGALVAVVTLMSAVVTPAFAATKDIETGNRENRITANRGDDLAFGRARVFIKESGFSGELVMSSVDTANLHALPGVKFGESAVRISHEGGKRVSGGNSVGEMFIYFTMSAKQYAAWQMGKIAIYHYDRQMNQWVKLTTVAVHMSKDPRTPNTWVISARGVGYGIYGLGETQ